MSVPLIAPRKTKTYHLKQSKYEIVHKLPFKSLIYSPPGGGKTVLITNLIEHVYRDCFERIYVFSPSINIDDAWKSTKRYLNESITLGENEPSLYQDNFDESVVDQIMSTQKKNNRSYKEK